MPSHSVPTESVSWVHQGCQSHGGPPKFPKSSIVFWDFPWNQPAPWRSCYCPWPHGQASSVCQYGRLGNSHSWGFIADHGEIWETRNKYGALVRWENPTQVPWNQPVMTLFRRGSRSCCQDPSKSIQIPEIWKSLPISPLLVSNKDIHHWNGQKKVKYPRLHPGEHQTSSWQVNIICPDLIPSGTFT